MRSGSGHDRGKAAGVTSPHWMPHHQKMLLQDVFDLYEERLKLVEAKIRSLFENRIPAIPLIGGYITSSGGKRLRPLFHLICADIAGYAGEAHIEISGIIESIHTASLLHDDVVDMAGMRRGKPTANSVWGNQIVVLVGDFLYSNALRTAVMQKNQKIMEVLSGATTRMTEGEILQLNRIGDPDITEAEYLEIIAAKTGGLISAACRIGGILGGLPEQQELALGVFGMKTGMVFQMADDILDYMAAERDLGKKICKDLEEGKITLPLLRLLKTAAADEAVEIKRILASGISEHNLGRVLELLAKHRAIDASFEKARGLVDEAKAELSVFPDSTAKEALITIADYSLYREK
ncbi:MAG: polyprenyl synthetase family protein [Nitrospiraceae bacterium]|nr:polyprenyl synthetase family protein [Nitrospiraceae bacterium]